MRKFAFLILLLLTTASAFAQNIDRQGDDWRNRRYHAPVPKPDLTLTAGYRWGGTLYREQTGFRDDYDVASSAAYGAILGVPIGLGEMKLELSANHQATHLEVGGELFNPNEPIADFDVTYFQAGLRIPLTNAGPVQPFVSLGLGVANLDINTPGLSNETRFAMSGGIGAKVPLNDHLAVRFEARGYFASLSDSDSDYYDCHCDGGYGQDLYQGETSIGLMITF
jgi:opacity protein-like surface antigen